MVVVVVAANVAVDVVVAVVVVVVVVVIVVANVAVDVVVVVAHVFFLFMALGFHEFKDALASLLLPKSFGLSNSREILYIFCGCQLCVDLLQHLCNLLLPSLGDPFVHLVNPRLNL